MNPNPFARARFVLGAHELAQLPPDEGREIAIAGRSNVGKSSVINSITGNARLARTSKTPGRTQQLNCYAIDSGNRLIDLPGYGYARVPEKVRRHWGTVLQAYFNERCSLYGLFLVMDVRHPLKPYDLQMLDWCRSAGLPVHVILNKADKLSRGAAAQVLQSVRNELADDNPGVQLFSATDKSGVEEAREHLAAWLLPGKA